MKIQQYVTPFVQNIKYFLNKVERLEVSQVILFDNIMPKLTTEEQNQLLRPFTLSELQNTFKKLNPLSAGGADAFNHVFFSAF